MHTQELVTIEAKALLRLVLEDVDGYCFSDEDCDTFCALVSDTIRSEAERLTVLVDRARARGIEPSVGTVAKWAQCRDISFALRQNNFVVLPLAIGYLLAEPPALNGEIYRRAYFTALATNRQKMIRMIAGRF